MSLLHFNNELAAGDKSKLVGETSSFHHHDEEEENHHPQHQLVSLPPSPPHQINLYNFTSINESINNNTTPKTPLSKTNHHQEQQQEEEQQEIIIKSSSSSLLDKLPNIPKNNENINEMMTIMMVQEEGNEKLASSPPIPVNDHPLLVLQQEEEEEKEAQIIAPVKTTTSSSAFVATIQPSSPLQQVNSQIGQQIQHEGIATIEEKEQPKNEKLKRSKKEEYNDEDTENDLFDNDLEFTADELEMLKSKDPPPISFDLLSEIPQIPPHMRSRLTILQQQQIIYSLHSLNLNDKQRKELMLLGNVMKRITQDELMKCSIFESVNVYLFILCVSTLAAAVGTLALALIYFVVLKDAIAEGTFSIVVSAIFTITLVSCILLCVAFNIKNRPKHKLRKTTLAHYHEVFEEAIYDIGVKFFPNFEIEFDYHNIIDNEEIEELESKRRKLRQNYRYYEYFRSKRLLSKNSAEQLLCYLHITSAENFDVGGIKKLFKIHNKEDDEQPNNQKEEGNQKIVQIRKIPSYFSSFSTTNNSGIFLPAAVIEQTSTPGDNIWYSVCCAFGGLCTLIIVIISLLFSAICLFFPLIYGRSPKIPIFNTFPIEVGYGMVGVLGLTFLILLCFSSCSIYCCLFVKQTNRSTDGYENDEEGTKPLCCCYFELDNNDDDGFLAPVGDLI